MQKKKIGDMVPATFIGKLITFPAMLFGLLVRNKLFIVRANLHTLIWLMILYN